MIPLHKFLFALLAAVNVSYAADTVRDYPVDRIAPHTYVIHGPLGYPSVENQGFMNNPGFVVTDAGVVLIDPGSSVQAGRMVLKQIKTITDKEVTHVVNTHVHGDHWLGNQAVVDAFPRVVLMAHPAMIQEANAGAGAQWVAQMERVTERFTQGTRAVVPTVSTAEDVTLETGGMSFRFYAPEDAHSGTDVMIQVVEDSVVFLGDNVTSGRIPRMDDGTFRGNIAACQVAADIGAEHYVPGHGPSGGVDVVQAFGRYLSVLYAEVERLYEEGESSDYEMKPKILPLLKPYRTWVGFDDQVGRHIGLAIAQVEEDSF